MAQRGTDFTSLPGLRGASHLGDHSPLGGESRVSVDSYETSSHTRVGGQTLAALVGFPAALHDIIFAGKTFVFLTYQDGDGNGVTFGF